VVGRLAGVLSEELLAVASVVNIMVTMITDAVASHVDFTTGRVELAGA
jgi:hypothetical protein